MTQKPRLRRIPGQKSPRYFVNERYEFPERGLPLCWWLGAIPFILARTMPHHLKAPMTPGVLRPGSPAL
jgi:hypothetical protein